MVCIVYMSPRCDKQLLWATSICKLNFGNTVLIGKDIGFFMFLGTDNIEDPKVAAEHSVAL